MIRTLVGILALAAPLFSQTGIGMPFAMTGGPLCIGGTFTAGEVWPECSGVASLGGQSTTFGPGKPFWKNGIGAQWRFNVTLGGDVIVLVINVDPFAPPGQQLTGYWYPGANPHQVTLLNSQ